MLFIIVNGYVDRWKDSGIKKTRSSILNKETSISGGANQEVSGEKFTVSGNAGEDLALFRDQNKLKGLKEDFEKTSKGAEEIESDKKFLVALGGVMGLASAAALAMINGNTMVVPAIPVPTSFHGGIKKYEIVDTTAVPYDSTSYTLPEGITIYDNSYIFPDRFQNNATAFDREGYKLKTTFVKDEKTGHQQIRVENNNGTITDRKSVV